MLSEYVFSISPVLFLLGVFFLMDLRLSGMSIAVMSIALPVGAVIWCLTSFIILSVGIELNFWTVLSLSVALIFLFHYRLKSYRKLRVDRFGVGEAIVFVVFLVLLGLVQFVDFVTLTADSLQIMYMAHSLAEEKSLSEVFKRTYTWAFPLLIPFVSSASEVKDFTSFPAFNVAVSVLLIFFVGSYSFLLFNRRNRFSISFLLAVFSVLVVFSPEIMVFNIFYLNNHFLVAFLFLMLSFLVDYKERFSKEQISRIFTLLLIGISISRIEGFLVTLIAYLYFSGFLLQTTGERKRVAGCIFVFEIFYLSFLAVNGGEYRGTIIKMWILALGAGLYLGLVTIISLENRFRFLKHIMRNSVPYLFAGLLVVILIGVLFRADHMATSIENIALNLFAGKGNWGAAWWLAIFLGGWISVVRHRSAGLGFSLLYLVFVYALSAVHFMPYRLGFGDSANRMFVHIYPVIIVCLISSVTNYKRS